MFDFLKKKHGSKLAIYNTLTREKEQFVALNKNSVTMYSCGPTVYDDITIGNIRSFVFADTLKRTLLFEEFTVSHTMNLTDFGHLVSDADEGEDKMMKALRRHELPVTLENMLSLASEYGEKFKSDMLLLNVLKPTRYTPASCYVDEQIELIKRLEAAGYTYETSDGIYFDISKFPEYGKLGNIDVEKLKEGARIAVNEEKKHPADFALWKKGELGWNSDWGKGFPGWHIECTAMAFATLGEQIDIHTGGEDLMHTHHNGEIAQAEAATNKAPYVHYWMHNAFITIDGARLGKSMGNAITLSELMEQGYSPLAYRYWLLTSHYRSPANFTYEALDGAAQALTRIYRYLLEHHTLSGTVNTDYIGAVRAALCDDLNTPKAIAVMWDLMKDERVSDEDRMRTLREFDRVLGLGFTMHQRELRDTLGNVADDDLPEDVQKLLEARKVARDAKDFEESDRLRDELTKLGYTIEDSSDGQKVRKS